MNIQGLGLNSYVADAPESKRSRVSCDPGRRHDAKKTRPAALNSSVMATAVYARAEDDYKFKGLGQDISGPISSLITYVICLNLFTGRWWHRPRLDFS